MKLEEIVGPYAVKFYFAGNIQETYSAELRKYDSSGYLKGVKRSAQKNFGAFTPVAGVIAGYFTALIMESFLSRLRVDDPGYYWNLSGNIHSNKGKAEINMDYLKRKLRMINKKKLITRP